MRRTPDHASVISDMVLLIILAVLFTIAVYLGIDLVIYCLKGIKQ